MLAPGTTSTAPLDATNCNRDDCNVEIGANFVRLISDTDFEKYNQASNAPSGWSNLFTFQLAWRIDDCSVAVLEWNQNASPIKVYGTATLPEGVQKPSVIKFQQRTCKVSETALQSTKEMMKRII